MMVLGGWGSVKQQKDYLYTSWSFHKKPLDEEKVSNFHVVPLHERNDTSPPNTDYKGERIIGRIECQQRRQ